MTANAGGLCPVPDIHWQGETPAQCDVYYNRNDAMAESMHVYLQGNNLPQRFAACCGLFTLAEVGFGTGLNFLVAAQLWQQQAPRGARLRYLAFEPLPLSTEQMTRALRPFTDLRPLVSRLLAIWPPLVRGNYSLWFAEDIELQLHLYPLQEFASSCRVDAWFYDAFAPARDKQAWDEQAMATIARCSTTKTTLATFSVASKVRTELTALGFCVHKAEGYDRKRHMLTARFQGEGHKAPSRPSERPQVAIIGGGLAGCSLLHALTEQAESHGAESVLFERRNQLAGRASRHGNAVLFAKIPWLASARQEWLWHCWCASFSRFSLYSEMFRCIPKTLLLPGKKGENWLAGWQNTYQVRAHGEWLQFDWQGGKVTLPRSGLLDMRMLACLMATQASKLGAEVRCASKVQSISRDGYGYIVDYWQGGATKREAFTHVVLCTNSATSQFYVLPELHLYKGQVNRVKLSGQLRQIYGSNAGYLAPYGKEEAECGGAFTRPFANLRPEVRQGEIIWENMASQIGMAGQVSQHNAWADIRSSGQDHLPLAGIASDGEEKVYLHAGYGGKGSLTIVPTSRMLAASILGKESGVRLPDFLSPQRFATQNVITEVMP